MDDDWQSAAFTSRHMHNRVHQSNSSRRNHRFDVHRTFGSYKCTCVAWKNRYFTHDLEQEIMLELYRLTPNGEGIIGEICFPGVLKAAVILAASRKSLDATVQEIEAEVDDDNGSEESDVEGSDDEQDSEEQLARFQTFEKNSFRTPKFWLRWNGVVEGSETVTSDGGYVIFSGDDCRKFRGTLTCALMDWKDVAINGHKIARRGASDVPVTWSGQICRG